MSDSFFRKAIQEKIGEGNAQPENALWDNIDGALAQKRAAKSKNRFLLSCLLSIFLLGLGSLFYFVNEKQEIIKIEGETTVTNKIENEADKNDQLKPTKNELVEKYDKVSSLESKKKKSKDRNNFEIQEKGQDVSFVPVKKPNSATNNFFQKESFAEQQWQIDNSSTRPQVEKIETLISNPQFLEIEETHPEISEMKIAKIEFEKEQSKKKNFSIGINYGINQLAYCFDEKANNETAQMKLGYRFYRYFSANLGIGFHNVNYAFDVDSSNHIASFGNTDKYPSFHKLKNDVEQIESRLSYFTLPVAINFHLPINKRLTATLTSNQDFVYNQDQLLIYTFKSGADDLEFRESKSKLNLGFTTFRLGFDYPIIDGLRAEVGFNRIVTFKTLGLENQYYHGFGGDFGMRYEF